jgi:hypothetical protein
MDHMDANRDLRAVPSEHRRGGGTTLLLVTDPDNPDRFVGRPNRLRDRVAARLLAYSLDRRLAAGSPPESSPLLASRARQLVAPASRRELVHNWEHLVDLARRGPSAGGPHAFLCRERIAACEADVGDMTDLLGASSPTQAAGVAMARQLLCDATGPLYNRRSPTDLRTALRETITRLDASQPLAMSA